jgi:hypothetical protein
LGHVDEFAGLLFADDDSHEFKILRAVV